MRWSLELLLRSVSCSAANCCGKSECQSFLTASRTIMFKQTMETGLIAFDYLCEVDHVSAEKLLYIAARRMRQKDYLMHFLMHGLNMYVYVTLKLELIANLKSSCSVTNGFPAFGRQSMCVLKCPHLQCVCQIKFLFSPTDTTSSSSCTPWESLENYWPFTLLCRSYAGLECTPWDSPTCITCRSTTTTASSSSCCPTSHVRSQFIPTL